MLKAPNPSTPRGRVRPTPDVATAPAHVTGPVQFCVGVVMQLGDGGAFCVQAEGDVFTARRAASCLLEPAPGDSVACLHGAAGEAWVTAVLHRDEGAVHVLSAAKGAAGLRMEGAPIALRSTRIELDADRLDGRFGSVGLAVDRAEVVGRHLSVVAGQLKAVGQLLSTVMERVQHFSRGHTRTTEGIDRTAATHVEVAADELLRMDAEHALVNGRSLVKARGAQIHFG